MIVIFGSDMSGRWTSFQFGGWTGHFIPTSHVSTLFSHRDCDSRADDMDKDNRDDFTFAKLSDLKVPVTLRMSAVFRIHPQNCAQESRIVHSSKDPGFLALSPNSWRNRS